MDDVMLDAALAARLRALYSGVVSDAVQFDLRRREPFILSPAVKPAPAQPADVVLVGPAFTCEGAEVEDPEDIDDLFRLRMLDDMTPGCVQVIVTGGNASCAHFGDISGRLAAAHGAVGVLIDGSTRDAVRLARDRFPVFCRTTTPADAFGQWQLVRHQHPVVVAGIDGDVEIRPGDWIFGDADGVLRVRQDDIVRVVAAAEQRLAREDEVRTRIGSAAALLLYEEVGRW
jgi:regulator of RNase E activity RraA